MDLVGSEATNRCQGAAGASKSIENHSKMLRERFQTVGRRPGRSRRRNQPEILQNHQRCCGAPGPRVNKAVDTCSCGPKRAPGRRRGVPHNMVFRKTIHHHKMSCAMLCGVECCFDHVVVYCTSSAQSYVFFSPNEFHIFSRTFSRVFEKLISRIEIEPTNKNT